MGSNPASPTSRTSIPQKQYVFIGACLGCYSHTVRVKRAAGVFVTACLASLWAFTAAPVGASQQSSELVGRLVQLASNDGRYEASGAPTWFVAHGDSLIPIATDQVAGKSGDLVRFAKFPGNEISEIEIEGARISKSGVLKSAVVPNRMLTVVPIIFAGSSWTVENQSVANQVATNTKSWWRTMSAYRETLEIRFTPTLNLQSIVTGCDIDKIRKEVLAYADALGLKKSSQHVMATFTGPSISCGFGGMGELGGPWSATEPLFTWTYTDNDYASKIWIHELGHNLGLPHANSCLSGYVFTYLRPCQDMEYGNTMAVMGFGDPQSSFTPKELLKIGWLPESNVATWNLTTSTYELQNFSRTEAGITALKIPAISSALGDVDFWLQYSTQAKTYYNSRPATVVSSGILVTFDPSDNYRDTAMMRDGALGSRASLSYLCDLTPDVNNPYVIEFTNDPRLLLGQTWTEPRGRYSVRVDAVTAEKATVTITSLVPVLASPTTVTAVQDPNGTASINFLWSPLQVSMGSIEPLEWVADIAEDPTKTCRGNSIVWRQCSITGLVRGSTYTPRMIYSTGTVVSQAVSAAPITITQVAPVISATSATTAESATVSVKIDDGGSPMVSPTVVSLEGQSPCQIAEPAGGVCVFDGLARNREYSVTVTSTNSIGSRTAIISAKTLSATPDRPVLSAEFKGSDLHLTIATTERDQTNVMYFWGQCLVNSKSQKSLRIDLYLNPGESLSMFTIPNARKKLIQCSVFSYAALYSNAPGAPKNPASDSVAFSVLKSGKILLPRITATIVATSPRPGVVTLKWTVVDKNGKVLDLSVKTSKKACVYRGRTTCTIKKLVSGSMFAAVVRAYGPSGAISHRTTVVVQ